MRLRFLAVLAPLVVVAAPASAANPAPQAVSPQAMKEARKLTGEATVEYNVGNFEHALDLYTQAYERSSKPALLFNLGQCHRQLGHAERALFFFQGYLREQPATPNRALVEKLIADAQRLLDAQHAKEAADQARAAEAAAAATAPPAPPPTEAPVAATSETPPVKVTEGSSSTLRIVGLATAGVGALLIGGGVYMGLRSASLSNEISQLSSQQGTWTPQYQSDYETGKSLATVATVAYIAGGAVLATGLAFALFGGGSSSASTTGRLTPVPGGASLDLVARF